MNRIDQLIAEMCPDGVEYVPLGSIGVFIRGNGLQKKDLIESGVGAIHYGQLYTHYGVWTTETKSFVSTSAASKLRKAKHGDLVIATTSENDADVCKAVAWLGSDEIAVSGDAFIYRHEQDPRYLSYFLQSEFFNTQKTRLITGTKVKRVSGENLGKILIPLPPLPIQHEIVKILDTFAELEAKLEAKLEAELEARKKQYEYYRDELLTFGEDEVEWKTLGEVATNLDSKRKPVTKSSREKGEYPYYGASGIVDYVSDYLFDGDYLLVSEDGANLLARTTPIAFSISGKTWVNNHAHVLEFQHVETRKLVEYYLNSIDLTQYITGAAQPKLNKASLSQIPVPVPSLADQGRVVSSLEKFDALVNDLSSGLPAEIAARRKQYEHYRDRLLTFPERKS